MPLPEAWRHPHAAPSSGFPGPFLAVSAGCWKLWSQAPATCTLRCGPCLGAGASVSPRTGVPVKDRDHTMTMCPHQADTRKQRRGHQRGRAWVVPAGSPAQATWPHFLRPPSPHFLPLTLLIPNPVRARLSLPPYIFKPCDLAPAHLLSTQAACSKGSVTSLLSDPMTIFRPRSSWHLSGSGNDDCSSFKFWYNKTIIV